MRCVLAVAKLLLRSYADDRMTIKLHEKAGQLAWETEAGSWVWVLVLGESESMSNMQYAT